jgi:diguanylate cyclase (GGDEF)-like protein/PAS domain S-box-containing protein
LTTAKEKFMRAMLFAMLFLVFLLMVFISWTNHKRAVSILESEFQNQRVITEENILTALRQADLTARFMEHELTRQMKQCSFQMLEKYKQNPDVANWDLKALQQEFAGHYEIYILNEDLKVIHTTFEKDLGMDFSRFPDFAEVLYQRLKGDKFTSDRVDVSINTGNLYKYSYVPTPDNKYLLELGVNLEEKYPMLKKHNILALAERMKSVYESVESIFFYKLGQEKDRIREIRDSYPEGTVPDVDKAVLRHARKALLSDEPQVHHVYDKDNLKKITHFIPYANYMPEGGLDWQNSYVTAFTYSAMPLQNALRRENQILGFVLFCQAIAFGALGAAAAYLFYMVDQSRRTLSTVINRTSEGYCLLDCFCNITDVNDALCRMLGYDRKEIIGARLSRFMKTRPGVADFSRRQSIAGQISSQNPHLKIEQEFLSGSKQPFWVVINATGVFRKDGGLQYIFAFVYDVTERKKAEDLSRRLALYDPLTGIANRKLMTERLEQELARIERHGNYLGILFMDVDNFKSINDTLGHGAGDIVLCEVARRTEAVVRKTDTVSRLGGDEFIILLNDIKDVGKIADMTGKILRQFDCPIEVLGNQVSLKVSIGASIAPRDGMDFHELLKKADQKMFKMKSSKKKQG